MARVSEVRVKVLPIVIVRIKWHFDLPVVSNDSTYPRLLRKPLQVSFTVEHTDATQIHLQVTVSSPATVWCGAWSFGELIDFISLQQLTPGLQINRSVEGFVRPKVVESTCCAI